VLGAKHTGVEAVMVVEMPSPYSQPEMQELYAEGKLFKEERI